MLKRVLLAAVATGLVAATAVPMQFTSAQAGMMSCKEVAKAKFAKDRKARHAYKKACKEAHKA
jgi:hypothetical protein